jgi:hypothetical protein
MNIFINIYNGWTVYEWVLLTSSVFLIFFLANLFTYITTKKIQFNISLSITYLISIILYILVLVIAQFLKVEVSHISLLAVGIIPFFVTLNWLTLIFYYRKYKDSKSFSELRLIKEYRKDTVRNIVFLTLGILSILVFLRGELFVLFISIYIPSVISMYLNTFLNLKLIHD